MQVAFKIDNLFWAHQNWRPNFDKLVKNKNDIKSY